MASNNHKRRRSHLATPVEQSTSSSTASPPKRSRSNSNPLQQTQQQKPVEICGLGLRKITRTKPVGSSSSKQQQKSKSKLGPMIHLCPKMYLGRTPPYLTLASKSTKSLNMTHDDFHNFCRKHSIAQKHALLGLDRTKNASKQENEAVMTVSRMLLQIVDSSSNSIKLKRCPELCKPDGRQAKQVRVRVHRPSKKPSGTENEVNGSSQSTTQSSKAPSGRIAVEPDATVTLREGDILAILGETYCYKVVRNPNSTSAEASAPKTPRVLHLKVGGRRAGAIDLLQSSSSSSSDSSGMEIVSARNTNEDTKLAKRRAQTREASRRYRARLTADQKKAKVQRQSERKREMLNEFTAEEKEQWRLRQRGYDRNYEAALGSEGLQQRREKQRLAMKASRQKDVPENLESTAPVNQETSSISRSSLGGKSLSSLNDRTIVLDDDDDAFEQDTRAAIKLSLQSPKQTRTPIPEKQEIITIASSSNSDENEKKSNSEPILQLSKDYKFETPNCKPSASQKEPKASQSNPVAQSGDAKPSAKPAPPANSTSRPKTMKRTTAATKQATPQPSKEVTKSEQLRINLRQRGLRIQTVMVQEMNEAGEVVDKPLHEILSAAKNTSKQRSSKTNQNPPIDGPILSLESPTKRFWDSSWGCDTNSAITVTPVPAETQPQTNDDKDSTLSTLSPLPTPTDTPASMGVFYWNALQSARPREGAWFLNASIVAANTVPGPALWQKWMDLLTWGSKMANDKNQRKKVRVFTWDGPKMDYSMRLWKTAIALHPQIVLPRMVCAAPGGPFEWWKTCLAYDDIVEDEQRRNQQHETGFAAVATSHPHDAARRIIHCLRMRSARLECLLHLLHANLKFEKEHHEKLRVETEQAKSNVPTANNDLEDDSSSDEEEEPNDSLESQNREKALLLLKDIRACGSKPVVRLVALAMSKFWVAQRNYLGYSSNDQDDLMDYTLEQERSELVQEVAERFSQLLETLLKILANNAPSRRRSRRKRRTAPKDHKEAIDILWNTMDMELGECPSKKRRTSDPRDAFLIEWVWSLQESVGTEFAQELATKIGIQRHLEDLWEL